MVLEFPYSVILPAFIGLFVSFLIERLLQPGTQPPWKRRPTALMIHCGIWLLLYSFELAVFRRPWFAVAIVTAFFLFVVLVSNAKLHALREPFVFQDFEYFTDALRHPRLYFPFLGRLRAFIAVCVFSLAFFAGIRLENALTATIGGDAFWATIVLLVLVGLFLLWTGSRKRLAVTFDPIADIWQLGMIPSLWRYAEEERVPPPRVPSTFDRLQLQTNGRRPNLVAIQSESFFDVRRLYSGIKPEVLRQFDSVKADSMCHGQVEVSAWGANTVRTEFSFLSGFAAESIGVHRFNPYRRLAQQGISTLASFLKGQGYRTVCVHPYPASFYDRERVYPSLGFDEFIDIRQFEGVERTGPYIGDLVLAEKVCSLLSAGSESPIFIYVITMENHGPLHLEKPAPGDSERFYSAELPGECEDLTIYLRHIANADRMIQVLRDRLLTLAEPSYLCWFGDHVPIMPKVYRALGEPSGATDYFIWSSERNAETARCQDLKIENLAMTLLREMGLINTPMPIPQSHIHHVTSV